MPAETPSPTFGLLTTGFFHEGPAYRSWRPKGTDDWLLVLTTGGSGQFRSDRDRRDPLVTTTAERAIALVRPHTRHDYGTAEGAERWDLLWAHFHPRSHWLDWFDWPETFTGHKFLALDEPVYADVLNHLHEAHLLAGGARRRREDLAMNRLEAALLACDAVNPRVTVPDAGGDRNEPAAGPLDDRVRDAMDFACRNLTERLTLESLADVAGLSVSRFAHLFREQTGATPQRFVEQQRITQARQLLELSSRSIKQIASDLGFGTQFYFSQRFKKLVGVGPREYRRGVRPGR